MRLLGYALCATALSVMMACRGEAPVPPPAAKTPGLIQDAAVLKGRTPTPVVKAAKSPSPAIKATTTTAEVAKTTEVATPIKATGAPAAKIPTPAAPPTTATVKGTPMPPKEATPPTSPAAAATPLPAGPGKPVAVIKTNLGEIEIELDPARAPVTTQNFLYYVQSQHYAGTIFHRVIGNFMIQGGGFTPDLKQKSTAPPIKNESGNGLSNVRGAVAMARTQALDSATCQFYINVADNPGLDAMRYCVFGKVTAGMDVVDKIRAVPTHAVKAPSGMPMEDVPVQAVLIESVRMK